MTPISPSVQVIIDHGDLPDQDIIVPQWAIYRYIFFPLKWGEYRRSIQIETGWTLDGSALILHDSTSTIVTEITGDHASSHFRTLAIAADNSRINIDGIAIVDKPYRHVEIRFDQTNILIGNNTQIRGIPRLQIATDDISGWHSCRIHRLSGDALIYLTSRGIPPQNAEELMLSGEIRSHLSGLDDENSGKLIMKIEQLLRKTP